MNPEENHEEKNSFVNQLLETKDETKENTKGWTKERKEAQRIRMIETNERRRKSKEEIPLLQTKDTKEKNEEEENIQIPSQSTSHSFSYYATEIFFVILIIIGAIIFFIKTGTIKFQNEGEK